ncbi:MAG: metallophosphoesterase [Burkholderiaceae bacterium]|nr:metallophosphoesterase [Burkholderiaceae bacterium]
MSSDDQKQGHNPAKGNEISRRDFIKYSAGTIAGISLSSLTFGCGGSTQYAATYPIDSTVVKTSERMITFSYTPASAAPASGVMPNPANPAQSPNGGTALTWDKLDQLAEYDKLGYGKWEYINQPLPIMPRTDIMPASYSAASVTGKSRLLNFFAMTDIHLTDKEAPNQMMYLQKGNPGFSGQNSSIYSGVMLYTPHVFDAAIQTANALHKKDNFDFFISLGDVCNSTSYNELRWYIDIIDGKRITPSSGAHLGADSIDYQKPFQAAGLDKSIPFYQTLGNHDHFMIGSFPVYADPNLDFGSSYVSDTVWAVPNELLTPNTSTTNPTFPANFSKYRMTDPSLTKYYQGVIDGTSPYGTIVKSGSQATPPKVVADANRRSLLRTEWIQEFFNTSTSPVGHGFNLVSSNPNFKLVPADERAGFACYSFVPKSTVPLKVIVLDDTQREDDGSVDIHGHGFLDATRLAWLKAELADGKAANQLMIIAAHIPIAVSSIGTEMEWWLGDKSTTARNACTLKELVDVLQNSENLLMWIAGHRHVNTIKAFVSPDPANAPEKGFWQVESSSLRDFPQQFRTFEIYLNSDYTISIEAVNVDIAVKEGTPAATSRKYAIATQQILQNQLKGNAPNFKTMFGVDFGPMDPTRPQGGDPALPHSGDAYLDPSIQFVDLSSKGIPYNASYNARLFKQLSPAMVAALKNLKF